MEGKDARGGPALPLPEGFERSGLSFNQAWVEYVIMGGRCSREQVSAALDGHGVLDRYEHNKLAAALNEYYADAGEDHPVETHDDEPTG